MQMDPTNNHRTTTLTPYDATHTTTVTPPLHPQISTFSAATTTSLLAGHGGLISYINLNPTPSLHSTTRTHLDNISSLRSFKSSLAAVGSDSFYDPPGVHFFDVESGSHFASVLWSDRTDQRTLKARVTAINDESEFESETSKVFVSFDCRHRENAVLVIDTSTLQVVSEIGRQTGNSAKSAALTKLKWVPSLGVLVGSSVKCGAFGYSGYIRLWDVRSGKAVWETDGSGRGNRLGDTMADVDADVEGLYVAKVGSRSGDVGVADMRRLGDDPWVYLEEPNPGLRSAGPVRGGAVVHCWNKHVFVARDGALEAWSAVKGCGENEWERYRRNYMDKEEDEKRGIIRKIGGSGNRLFIAREDVEGVEIWESSRSSSVITVS